MNFLIPAILIIAILYIGRALLLPILVAVFFWYLLYSIAAYYRKLLPYKDESHGFKHKAFNILAGFMSVGTFGFFIHLFQSNIRPAIMGFIARIPEIQGRLIAFQSYVSDAMGIELSASMLPDTTRIIGAITQSTTQLLTITGLITIYIVVLFIEQSTFRKKLAALFPIKKQLQKAQFIIAAIDDNMKRYMFVKTAMSALNAIASYIFLWYIGFEFAFVWAFIVFVLNYIPTLGTAISVSLPVLFAFITGYSPNEIIVLAFGLGAIQAIVGNFLDPRLMGHTLNLSMLVIIINLVFWGMIWGPVGMFFSVPILVATFIIMAQFDKTRPIAILLSANGEIPDKKKD
ncbi:MAG: AI-2E family transporter [Alphaproteobacteria bacterium]|nr:AI-2E family transporter [Alphaproteobacteria bacterium]